MSTWLRSVLARSACALLLVACGSDGGTDETPSGGPYTLTAPISELAGFVLATRQVVIVSLDDYGEADFVLSSTMVNQLRGATEPSFCAQGENFTDVSTIPADTASCTWTYVDLGGNATHAESWHAGEGYVVRARDGALYRLLIVEDVVDPETFDVNVTFDVARVE